MIDVTVWTENFLAVLDDVFPQRVWFAGLQGSYGRAEATQSSDLDLVVILDELTAGDIHTYNAMLDRLPNRELICGFLSGKEELLAWEPSDLFQFCQDTLPLRGSLDAAFARIDSTSVTRAIRISACNIYHGCVHNMLYEKSDEILRGLYKAASFMVQAIYFRQTGRYIRRQTELREVAAPEERAIVDTFLALKAGAVLPFRETSEELFAWAKNWILHTQE